MAYPFGKPREEYFKKAQTRSRNGKKETEGKKVQKTGPKLSLRKRGKNIRL